MASSSYVPTLADLQENKYEFNPATALCDDTDEETTLLHDGDDQLYCVILDPASNLICLQKAPHIDFRGPSLTAMRANKNLYSSYVLNQRALARGKLKIDASNSKSYGVCFNDAIKLSKCGVNWPLSITKSDDPNFEGVPCPWIEKDPIFFQNMLSHVMDERDQLKLEIAKLKRQNHNLKQQLRIVAKTAKV